MLISQALLCNNSFAFMFKQTECIVYHKQHKIGTIKLKNNLYALRNTYYLNSISRISVYDLYKHLSHISYDYIKCLLQSNTSILSQKIINFNKTQCVDCIKANIEQTVLLRIQTLKISTNYSNIIYIDIVSIVSYKKYKNIQYLLILVNNTIC